MDCNCPAATALTEIVAEACGVNLKQIQKIAYQRSGNNFDGQAGSDILLLADWQTRTAAVDATKIVITPLVGGDPTIESGEAITTGGGDNSTLNGVEEVEGVNPSSFSCIFKGLSSKVESEMKELTCEKSLTVYLLLQGGLIACVEVVAATEHEGFPVQSVFTSDRNNAGFGTKDFVNHSFELAEGWSDSLVIVTPSFNPLTDL